ncbi:MAG TPA: hypothetical protein DCW96_03310 [Stenotrophomonas sp.]|nr:hypothetical protein [Stenotrophomonas sp.]
MQLKLWMKIWMVGAYSFEILSWTSRNIFSGVPLLVLSVLAYYYLPNITGTASYTLSELVEFFASNHEVLIGLLGLVIAIIAARSFMDSKRLDMRLSAATDIQDLTQRATRTLSDCNLLAESLVELQSLVRSQEWQEEPMQLQLERLEDQLIGVKVCYERGKRAQAEAWTLIYDTISISQKHRLAIASSAPSYIGMRQAQKILEEAASAAAFAIPANLEDLAYIVHWARTSESEPHDYIVAYGRLLTHTSFWLGTSSGAIGSGIFSHSGVALIVDLLDLKKLQRESKTT